jgi:muramoyltetrapeptide carboxypeptidase
VNPDSLKRGVAELEALGFAVQVGEAALERRHFTAGSIERRLRDLHALFADDTIRGVFCARGGAGSLGLLPALDVALIRARPKVLVGYSDITFVHAVLNNAGHVTFHGPLVAREFADRSYHRDSLLAAIQGVGPAYASEADELLPLREGAAEGRFLGGCLSILAAGCGTPWELRPPDDCILLLEDVDEPPYRVDRLLRQLRAAGVFARARGVVLGDFVGCSPPRDADYSLEDVILEALSGLDVPIALGLSTGHTKSPNLTLPLGVRARLVCEGGVARFEVLERAVS